MTAATKPRWRLLTDATRRELRVGQTVCVRMEDGRLAPDKVWWAPENAFGQWVIRVDRHGWFDLSRVVAVRLDPEPAGAV
jgi:hypothetical protein